MTNLIIIMIFLCISIPAYSRRVAITIDDLKSTNDVKLSSEDRTDLILGALKHAGDIQVILFVCGMRVDNKTGRRLLRKWGRFGHILANHSYSHLFYHSSKTSFEKY